MSKIVLVTGGARSGKSTYGEAFVTKMGKTIGYIATAIITDADMAKRIEHHKISRPQEWVTFELYKDFESLRLDGSFLACDTLILDCLTILITNQMFDVEVDYDTCDAVEVQKIEDAIKEQIKLLLNMIREQDKNLVIISNEVGLGLVPSYRLGNLFRDIAGRMNQYVASQADEAYFIVSGLPLKLK